MDKSQFFPPVLYNWMRSIFKPQSRAYELELNRILHAPKKKHGITRMLGKPLKYVDGESFYYSFKDVFESEIFKFEASTNAPKIIDCGSNIGLTILYFKQLYPQARITGFEPDPAIFSVLEWNIRQFGYDDVVLMNKAVWNKNAILSFAATGVDSGHIADTDETNSQTIDVESVRLKEFLTEEIDYLKIDIEGAEYEVIMDCAEVLSNAKLISIEYHSFMNRQQHLGEILQMLAQNGFRYYIRNIGIYSRSPHFELRMHEGIDNHVGIYAYRNDVNIKRREISKTV